MEKQTEIARAAKTLEEFLKSSDQRVLAFKGPWGIGKSFFIREFLGSNAKILPPFTTFASVFGLRTLSEVRDTVVGCMESVSHKGLATAGKIVSKAAAKIWDLPDISNTAFWHLAKSKGMLVVLDDIERAHKELSLEELLGYASSLTENSKAKVILIFNEGNIDGENAKILTRYREKVIDIELEYLPCTKELVDKFLQFPAVHEKVVQCLEAGGGANIRLLLRIKRALRDFSKLMEGREPRVTEEDLSQVAALTWLFYSSPLPVDGKTLSGGWVRRRMGRPGDISREEKRQDELIIAVNLQPTTLDQLVLNYLITGYFSESLTKKYQEEELTGNEKEEYQRRNREAYGPYTNNFRALLKEVADPVKKLLDDYADKIDIRTLKMHCDFIAELGFATGKWWQRHVEAFVSKWDLDGCRQYLEVVTDPATIAILRNRQRELAENFDPKAAILRITKSSSWHPDDITNLNCVSELKYFKWFNREGGDFLVVLRSFIIMFLMNPGDGAASTLRDKIFNVLHKIARKNRVNEMRIYGFLGVPRPKAIARMEPDSPLQ